MERRGELYRGEDRRLAARTQPGAPALLRDGCLVLVAVWATLATLPATDVDRVLPLLAVATTALGMVVGTLCVARWLIAGEAPALVLGVGTLAYAAVLVGVVEFVGLIAPEDAALIERLRPAARLTVLALFAAGALVPMVDARVRPLTVLGGALGVFTGLALLPGLEVFTDGAITLGACGLAGVFGLRGLRRGHWLFVSFALLLLALGLASVGMDSALGGPAIRLVGLGLALRGALRQLLMEYRNQSASLLSTRVSLATAEDRIRDSRQRAEEQAHEARSALAAIEGASSTLERYRDRLPPDTRSQLLGAVKGEIKRLQRLVDPATEPSSAFDVAGVVGPLAAAERTRGTLVEVRIPPGLLAHGRPDATADILRGLLDNARRYAPGPLLLAAEPKEGRVLLRVADRGRGVAAPERATIFTRGLRGAAARGITGSGLGLALALELARDQQGDLWVEDREGGGASFVLALPAGSAASAHHGDDGRERVEDDQRRPPRRRHGAHAGVGLAGEPDDDPGGHG